MLSFHKSQFALPRTSGVASHGLQKKSVDAGQGRRTRNDVAVFVGLYIDVLRIPKKTNGSTATKSLGG